MCQAESGDQTPADRGMRRTKRVSRCAAAPPPGSTVREVSPGHRVPYAQDHSTANMRRVCVGLYHNERGDDRRRLPRPLAGHSYLEGQLLGVLERSARHVLPQLSLLPPKTDAPPPQMSARPP
eukprot:3522447-Rhodomonas_salina.1